MAALANPTSFIEGLTPEGLEYFNSVAAGTFSSQAIAFLNAYWAEVGDQAEFIYSCAWEMIKACDMHAKGQSLVHLYEEGNDLDFNIGLYFYEKLCKQVLDDADAKWRAPCYAASQPEMLTAITRKKELREKVDVNFDGRVGFIEYLLYQYREFANPADFITRSMNTDTAEHPEIVAARQALDEVNRAIQAFEAEKYRLEQEGAGTGVKAMKAKHALAILFAGPLAETLNMSLIKAEAAVRRAIRLYGAGQVAVTDAIRARAGSSGRAASVHSRPTQGSLWWMGKDLEVKKARYGKMRK